MVDRRTYQRRLLLLWSFSIAWIGCLAWIAFRYGDHPIWLTTVVAIALFTTAPEPSLLFRSYQKYVSDWERDNEVREA